MSNAKSNEANDLIDKYLAANAENLSLWKSKLTLKIDQTNKSNEKELIDLFLRAIKSIKPKVIKLINKKKMLKIFTLFDLFTSTRNKLSCGS